MCKLIIKYTYQCKKNPHAKNIPFVVLNRYNL